MKGIFIFDQHRLVLINTSNPMAKKKEEWVNPRIIDFNLSKWDYEKSIHYIANYNGLFIGCAVSSDSGITYIDIAHTILNMELTAKMFSSNLSRKKLTVKDTEIKFVISPRRVEVTYGLSR